MSSQLITGYFYRRQPAVAPNQKPTYRWEYGRYSVLTGGVLGEFQALAEPGVAVASDRYRLNEYESSSAEVVLAPGSAFPSNAAEPVYWYLPGLCDVHAHLQISGQGEWAASEQMVNAGRTHLRHGILAIRDCGGKDPYPAEVRDHPQVPDIIHCGRHVAAYKRYIRNLPVEATDETLTQTLIQQAKRSDGWVKIVGDWIDRSAGEQADLAPLWSARALKEAIKAVHELGVKVTAHVFGQRALPDLIAAGIDGIEHGTGLSVDQARDLAQAQIPVTPTLMQVELFSEFARQAGSKYPVYAKTMQDLYNRRVEHFQMLIDSGVQLLPGTDSGGYQKPGSLGTELTWWAKYAPQLSTQQILEWASVRCREFFNWPLFENGEKAALVGYRSCPTKVAVRQIGDFLTAPDRVFFKGKWQNLDR